MKFKYYFFFFQIVLSPKKKIPKKSKEPIKPAPPASLIPVRTTEATINSTIDNKIFTPVFIIFNI